jgi:DNA-3-methyladenine glycosylase
MTGAVLPRFYDRPIVDLARALIGCTLTVDGVGGMIVETEAYHAGDPAAHSYRGATPRTATMFGPAGRLYVYRSYGLHWCMNIVGGSEPGAAVLLRAIEPLAGLDVMADRRGLATPRLLCAGPGRLCQALGITGAMDGAPLDAPPLALLPRTTEPPILVGPRIGISKAVDQPWRFGLAGSRYLSRGFPTAGDPR